MDHIYIDKSNKVSCHLCNKDLRSISFVEEHIRGHRHKKAQVALHAVQVKDTALGGSEESSLLGQNSGETEDKNGKVQEELQYAVNASVPSGIQMCKKKLNAAAGVDIQRQPELSDALFQVQQETCTDESGRKPEYEGSEFQNVLSLGGNTFMCTVCKVVILHDVCVEQHVTGKEHAKNLAIAAVNIEHLLKMVRELEGGRTNNIHMTAHNKFRCKLCCKNIDATDVVSHVEGSTHQQKLKELKGTKKKDAFLSEEWMLCDVRNIWNEIYAAENGKWSNICHTSGETFRCEPCKVILSVDKVLAHVVDASHQDAIRAPENIQMNETLMKIAANLWQEIHAADRTHQVYFKIDTGTVLYCTSCCVRVPASIKNMVDHIRGKNHMTTVTKNLISLQHPSVMKQGNSSEEEKSPSLELAQTQNLADRRLSKSATSKDLLKSRRSQHQIYETSYNAQETLVNALVPKPKESSYQRASILQEKSVLFVCIMCDVEFESEESWCQHTCSQKHRIQASKLRAEGKNLINCNCPRCGAMIFCIQSDFVKHNCRKVEDGVPSNNILGEIAGNIQQINKSNETKSFHKENMKYEEQDETTDNVPRIIVQGYPKHVGMELLYNFFKDFGIVSFIAVTGESAVIEFIENGAVEKVLARPLFLGEALLSVKSLSQFNHQGMKPSTNLSADPLASSSQVYEQLWQASEDSVFLMYEIVLKNLNEMKDGDVETTILPLVSDGCTDVEVLESAITVHESMVSTFTSPQRVEEELYALCKTTSSLSNPKKDEQVCRFLETSFSEIFSGCKAIPFGSRVSGLAFPDSDLDVFLDTGGMYGGTHRQESCVQELVVSVTESTLIDRPECCNVEGVPNARTPIVKFFHKPSETQCDVAFRHGLGCENTKLIKFYLSLDPRVRPVIIFLKHWAHLHKLTGQTKITNYALAWLVIFYLQEVSGFGLPTVEVLQKLHEGPVKIIAGWECSFSRSKLKIPAIRSSQSVLQLLHGFFMYYHNFDFSKNVVCPLIGLPVHKNFFTYNPKDLPCAMDSYVCRVMKNKHAERFRTKCCMCVQDPFDLSHNLTKGTTSATLQKFKILCRLTGDLFASIVS